MKKKNARFVFVKDRTEQELLLKSLRKSHRVQQQELAMASNMFSADLCRVENGWYIANEQVLTDIKAGYKKLGVKLSKEDRKIFKRISEFSKR